MASARYVNTLIYRKDSTKKQNQRAYLSKVAVVSFDIGIHRVSGCKRFLCSIVQSGAWLFKSTSVLSATVQFGENEVVMLRSDRRSEAGTRVQGEKIAIKQAWLFWRVRRPSK